MNKEIEEQLDRELHSIIAHATREIVEVDLPVINMMVEQAIKRFKETPTDHWRKTEPGNYPPVSELTCQSDDVIVQCSNEEMFIAFLDGTCADITWLDYEKERIFDVIAWQPLPKPMVL